jgi:hypothetical protein
MGIFDSILCEADLPPDHPEGERLFQTRSLNGGMDRFTITREGRLVLHACRYEPADSKGNGIPMFSRISVGDVDTDFHGDIRLTSTAEDRDIEYAARFTHGTLEWIRPWSELSEMHQNFLTPE